MVRLIETTNVYEDDYGKFETNMELQFMLSRPNTDAKYWFKDLHGNEVIIAEAQPYENKENGNYVKWLWQRDINERLVAMKAKDRP